MNNNKKCNLNIRIKIFNKNKLNKPRLKIKNNLNKTLKCNKIRINNKIIKIKDMITLLLYNIKIKNSNNNNKIINKLINSKINNTSTSNINHNISNSHKFIMYNNNR